MYKEIFASRLKTIREEVGYTQQEVADQIGISRTSINRYENKERQPDIENIGKLAEFYCISIDWLFGLGKREIDKDKLQ